jgi:hypothetical protein
MVFGGPALKAERCFVLSVHLHTKAEFVQQSTCRKIVNRIDAKIVRRQKRKDGRLPSRLQPARCVGQDAEETPGSTADTHGADGWRPLLLVLLFPILRVAVAVALSVSVSIP